MADNGEPRLLFGDVVDRYDSVLAGFSAEERQVATRLLEALCDQDGLPRLA